MLKWSNLLAEEDDEWDDTDPNDEIQYMVECAQVGSGFDIAKFQQYLKTVGIDTGSSINQSAEVEEVIAPYSNFSIRHIRTDYSPVYKARTGYTGSSKNTNS